LPWLTNAIAAVREMPPSTQTNCSPRDIPDGPVPLAQACTMRLETEIRDS
jgi:hypothetical protein